MNFAAIVLAGGASRRMGGPNKLLHPWQGRALATFAIEAACGSRAARVILVTDRDGEAVRALISNPKIAPVAAASGGLLSDSLRLGLAGVGGASATAVLLADMPLVDAKLVDALFWRWSPGDYAVVPTFEGRWGHPVLLGQQAMSDAQSIEGDRGARDLLRRHRGKVKEVKVGSIAILRDFDTPDDLREPGPMTAP